MKERDLCRGVVWVFGAVTRLLLVMCAATVTHSAAHARMQVYGSPVYDGPAGTGHIAERIYPTRGSHMVGVGLANKYVGGADKGFRPVRWDTTGWMELETLSTTNTGYGGAYALAVNASGTGVGYAQRFINNTFSGERAVRWDPGTSTPTELNHLDSQAMTGRAYAINSTGTIVGSLAYGPTGTNRAVRWDEYGTIATVLGTIGINYLHHTATVLNESGTIGGVAGKRAGSVSLGTRAVRWDSGGTAPTELGNLGTDAIGFTQSSVSAINAGGTLVGRAIKFENGISYGYRAVRWDAGGTTATELGILGTNNEGSTSSIANAVNDSGTVVGYLSKYVAGQHIGVRAVRWDAGSTVATELGTLENELYSPTYMAVAINAGGIAVGYVQGYFSGYEGSTRRALAWGLDGAAMDLNHLLSVEDAQYWKLTHADSITADGWVTGTGIFDPDGSAGPLSPYERHFMIQIPSPGAAVALALGLLLAARRR